MFTPGFRFSVLDAVVLAAGAVGSAFMFSEAPAAALVLACVIGHFFLFCNVFRISRLPELIWAAVFVMLAAATVLTEEPGWSITFGGSFLVALVLIYLEMRKPSYHGIGWRRINPHLRQWWETHGRNKKPAN
jgi:hypothetical protein